MSKLRVLDLFSGIGAFSLGLERTKGFETIAFCENHSFAQRTLAKRWPGVPCFDDVKNINGRSIRDLAPNVITAGFPCQDISHAGTRVGIEGERSNLWFEVVRIAGELRPDWLLLENVAAILGRGLDQVLGTLATIGFDAWWDCVRASDLNYPHERDRWFAVAYPAGVRRNEGERSAQEWRRIIRARTLGRPSAWAQAANNHEVRSGFIRVVNGLPFELDLIGRLTNEQEHNKKTITENNRIIWEILRIVWESREIAKASPDIYRRRLSDCVPGMPCEHSYGGWYVGARIEASKGLRRLWETFYAEPFEKAQDLQRRLLERIGKAKCHEAVDIADRLDRLGNSLIPEIPELIGRAILASCEEAA